MTMDKVVGCFDRDVINNLVWIETQVLCMLTEIEVEFSDVWNSNLADEHGSGLNLIVS